MDIETIKSSPLFTGINTDDLSKLCACLQCRTQHHPRGRYVWHAGDSVSAAALILTGSVRAERVTAEGERFISALHGVGGLIGDILMAEGRKSPVDVIAECDTDLLFIPFERIMTGCPQSCACHARLRMNLLQEIARKYWKQQLRVRCLEAPTLRQKLLLYLRHCAGESGTDTFRIPLNREELAAFLAVNRSALSRELSSMKQDGLIDFYRESFRLADAKGVRKQQEDCKL